MYKVNVAYTDYAGKPGRENVSFNLDAREVFKLLPELKSVFEWMESHKEEADARELDVNEVRDFYTSFEAILLEAYGEMSEDGKYFRKGGKFEFEESAVFNAAMVMFVTQPQEAVKLLQALLPKEMFDMVQNADPNQVAQATQNKVQDQQAEIERLRAQINNQGGLA